MPHEFSATRRLISPSHPSIYPSVHPSQFVPFYLYPLQVEALEERRRDVPILVYLVFVKGSAAFPPPPKARRDAAGATTVVIHAMQLCNCRVPANCPANQPQPDRRARRGEGWSGDWNYGTMEGGGLTVGAGDDDIRLALVRPPPPSLSLTLIEKLREGVDSTATDE